MSRFEWVHDLLIGNSLLLSVIVVGVIMIAARAVAEKLLHRPEYTSALAIVMGLAVAVLGGITTGGEHGIADVALLSGMGSLGGSLARDFTIITTAFHADLREIKRCGLKGIVALFAGVALSFVMGMAVALAFGYRNAEEITVIAAGAVTFIVGPVTATALNVHSGAVAVSIAAGLIKSIAIMIGTPLVAKRIGLHDPESAMIYGAMMGSTSGVSAGLAAADETLVPYGAMMATFYLGLGCLLCPTVLHILCKYLVLWLT